MLFIHIHMNGDQLYVVMMLLLPALVGDNQLHIEFESLTMQRRQWETWTWLITQPM